MYKVRDRKTEILQGHREGDIPGTDVNAYVQAGGEVLVYGDDIPFPEQDFIYSKEKGREALLEDIQHAESELECELFGEANEDLNCILESLKKGRYNVDEDTVKTKIAVIEKLMRRLEQSEKDGRRV